MTYLGHGELEGDEDKVKRKIMPDLVSPNRKFHLILANLAYLLLK